MPTPLRHDLAHRLMLRPAGQSQARARRLCRDLNLNLSLGPRGGIDVRATAETSTTFRTRLASLGLVLALVLSLLVATPAYAGKRTTPVGALELADVVSESVATSDVVLVGGPRGRVVNVQHRAPRGAWRTVLKARTNSQRRVEVAVRTLRVNGQWVWQARTGGAWRTAVTTTRPAQDWRVKAPPLRRWKAGYSDPQRIRARLTPAGGFALGLSGPTDVSTRDLRPGLSWTTVSRGRVSDGYVVSVRINGAEAGSYSAARAVAADVSRAGYAARTEKVVVPAIADAAAQTLYMVRVGRWRLADVGAAEKVAARLSGGGLPAWADLYADDGYPTTGPWSVHALRIDPDTFAGTCVASVGERSASRESTSLMAAQLGAIAGVNGGFFDINGPTRFSGDPLGVSVVAGELVSEAVDGRSALVLDGCRARVTEIATDVSVSVGGRTRGIDGLNRRARRDELVLYTDHLGVRTPADGGFEVVLDESGALVVSGTAGRLVPDSRVVLHGRGTAAAWLKGVASEPEWSVDVGVTDLRRGGSLRLTPQTHVIGGLVTVVRDGRTWINAATSGHASLGMVMRRHPRTLAGTTGNGDVVLVTVDGRRPTSSVGATFPESAAVLRWYGVIDGVALDGGGSTTMVLNGALVNSPAGSAERAVGDGLFVLP
jgi:hypothetical protein